MTKTRGRKTLLQEHFDDEFALGTIAYEGGMSILGIDDKELSGLYQRPYGLGIGVEGKVVLLVERSLALSHPRNVFAGDEFCLGEGDVDIDVLAVGFQLGIGGRDKLGVHHVDEQVGTVQFYAAGRNLAEVVGLDVVKHLLEKRMQSLVEGTVLEMGLYHGDKWTHPNPPYMEGELGRCYVKRLNII